MTSNEITTIGMEQNEEARRVPKGDQPGFFGTEFNVEVSEIPDHLASCGKNFYTSSQVMTELYVRFSA